MGKMFDALQKVEREKFGEPQDDSVKATPDDIVLDDKLVSFFQPSSMISEQFRRLRTHIIRPGLENTPKTILVTSAMAGEGKSLISINLAITIAIELHSHALLVDCDLRNPSISRWFGLHEEKGLSNYLRGEVEISDLLIKTSIDKLSVLSGGSIQDNPVELIGSNRMKSLVEDLKSRYEDRYIILDSSPLLATTEPSVLNKMVDGIILVVRAGLTPRESIQQAVRQLDKNKILGVVLNDLEFKTQALIRRNFGTHRYYYDYRYSKTHPEPTKWGKVKLLARDMKAFVGNLRPKKKDVM
ncbi:MAG: polysaccharide biosynthesis tyrosine autokinase [Deltaproteobacteria bacterium]|nr:polysaccharide biosynthesis tyrosine autokinase [Deltaproteobacteria bacterium]